MVKVVNSVSDALNAMQKENVGLKARVKADLQRAPVRGARLKGCSNGKKDQSVFTFMHIFLAGSEFILCRFVCRSIVLLYFRKLCITDNLKVDISPSFPAPCHNFPLTYYSLEFLSSAICLLSIMRHIHSIEPLRERCGLLSHYSVAVRLWNFSLSMRDDLCVRRERPEAPSHRKPFNQAYPVASPC